MTSDEEKGEDYKTLYEAERKKNHFLAEEVEKLKQMVVELTATTEVEEEFITNKLTKQLVALKREKERIAVESEQEEEYISNSLQRKLEDIEKEKDLLEQKLQENAERFVKSLKEYAAELQKLTDSCSINNQNAPCPCSTVVAKMANETS